MTGSIWIIIVATDARWSQMLHKWCNNDGILMNMIHMIIILIEFSCSIFWNIAKRWKKTNILNVINYLHEPSSSMFHHFPCQIPMWKFPKIGIPPQSPIWMVFSITNHLFWGTHSHGNRYTPIINPYIPMIKHDIPIDFHYPMTMESPKYSH